ncbi:HMCN2-like protein, partial [Mya arenaria]
VDECAGGTSGCQVKCSNVPGSFNCNVDECLLTTSRCQQTCLNFPGSYNCTCDSGYTVQSDKISCRENVILQYVYMYGAEWCCHNLSNHVS